MTMQKCTISLLLQLHFQEIQSKLGFSIYNYIGRIWKLGSGMLQMSLDASLVDRAGPTLVHMNAGTLIVHLLYDWS